MGGWWDGVGGTSGVRAFTDGGAVGGGTAADSGTPASAAGAHWRCRRHSAGGQ